MYHNRIQIGIHYGWFVVGFIALWVVLHPVIELVSSLLDRIFAKL